MTTGLPAYQQWRPAGVWARLGGSIIDYLLLTLLYVAVVGLFASPHYLNFTSPLLFDYALGLIFTSSVLFYALPLIFITLSAMLFSWSLWNDARETCNGHSCACIRWLAGSGTDAPYYGSWPSSRPFWS